MSCRSKTKPKKRTPCQKNNFCWTASGWTGKPMISNISTNWKDSDSSDTGWSYWIHPIRILNFQNSQDSPLRHRTPRHLPRFRWEIHPIPSRVSRTLPAQRCLGAFGSDIVAIEVKPLRRGVLHGLRHHLQLRGSAPQVQRVCRSYRARDGYNYNKTQTFPRAKHWFKSWKHLSHLLLQEPNTSLQYMLSN